MCSAKHDGKKSARELRQEKIDNYYLTTHPADLDNPLPEKAVSKDEKGDSVEQETYADKATSMSFLDEKKENTDFSSNKKVSRTLTADNDMDSDKAAVLSSSPTDGADSPNESETEDQEVVYEGSAGIEKSPSMTEVNPLCGACCF
jgi:hypothetical protein